MFSALRSSLIKLSAGARAKLSTAPVVERYSTASQVMHWTMGASVIGCIGFVQAAQYTKGKTKGEMMFYHKSCGTLAMGLLIPRLAVRLASKIPAHLPGSTVEVMIGKVAHLALYGFLIFMPVSGVAMGYFGGKGLPFFFTTIPGAEKANGAIAKQSFKFHKLIGHYGQYLIPLHLAGTATHIMKGQTIMPRMFSLPK